MNNSQLYSKWRKWLMQLISDKCETRLTNLVLLMVGVYLSKSVHLTRIATKLPIRAKKLSLVKRLSRFLESEAVDVDSWNAPWAKWLIQSASNGGKLRLTVDTTKVISSHRLLWVAAYRGRALPLIWSWVGHQKGHCTVHSQVGLWQRLYAMIPESVNVTVVGDGEFGNVLVLELMDYWKWDYALRQVKNTKIILDGANKEQRLDDLPLEAGQTRIYCDAQLTRACYSTNLVVIWRKTEVEPIYLATNQASILATW